MPPALQAYIQVPGHLASLPALYPVEGLPLGHGPCSCAHRLLAAGSGGDWCADRGALRHSAFRCAHWMFDTLGRLCKFCKKVSCAETDILSEADISGNGSSLVSVSPCSSMTFVFIVYRIMSCGWRLMACHRHPRSCGVIAASLCLLGAQLCLVCPAAS